MNIEPGFTVTDLKLGSADQVQLPQELPGCRYKNPEMLPGRLPWQTSSATLLARRRDGGQSGLAEQEMLSLRSASGILLVPALLLFRCPQPPGMKERGGNAHSFLWAR